MLKKILLAATLALSFAASFGVASSFGVAHADEPGSGCLRPSCPP
jgi:hypothetical protein